MILSQISTKNNLVLECARHQNALTEVWVSLKSAFTDIDVVFVPACVMSGWCWASLPSSKLLSCWYKTNTSTALNGSCMDSQWQSLYWAHKPDTHEHLSTRRPPHWPQQPTQKPAHTLPACFVCAWEPACKPERQTTFTELQLYFRAGIVCFAVIEHAK